MDVLSNLNVVGKISGDGSGITVGTRTVTADVTLALIDQVIYADASAGSITVTIPGDVAGRQVFIRKTDSSANTVSVRISVAGVPGSSVVLTGHQGLSLVTDGTSSLSVV